MPARKELRHWSQWFGYKPQRKWSRRTVDQVIRDAGTQRGKTLESIGKDKNGRTIDQVIRNARMQRGKTSESVAGPLIKS